MTTEELSSLLQTVYAETNGESVRVVEVIYEQKMTVEYQVKRFLRPDLASDVIDAQISKLEASKAELLNLKSSLDAAQAESNAN